MTRAHYGIDAPGLVRFFFLAGAGALLLFALVAFGPWLTGAWQFVIGGVVAIVSVYLLGMGSFMVYFSRFAKLRERERLLDLIEWTGKEQVLDVGCGRGLMLVGAAKRLTTGKATGIDLWQQQDQSNNSATAVLTNAELEGVSQRVEVRTADMRALPFPDASFDVILSNWAVHNLEEARDREKALDEMLRVSKPQGVIVVADIKNQAQYAAHFQKSGLANVKLHNQPIRDAVLRLITFGSFMPSTVLARKDT